jgi:hypothetical protein
MGMDVFMYVDVCVCVSVCGRERERKREREHPDREHPPCIRVLFVFDCACVFIYTTSLCLYTPRVLSGGYIPGT